jgi:uncharacterized protein YmfQ (DUF2313 family)
VALAWTETPNDRNEPSSLEQYRLMALALLPRGTAFALHKDSGVSDFLEGCVAEFARIDEAVRKLLDSALPIDAVDWLEDWEKTLGLPKPQPFELLSTADRQRAATSWLLADGANNYATFAKKLGELGLTIEKVHYYRPFATGASAVGDAVLGDGWMHTAELDVGGAGDPMLSVDWDYLALAQRLVDEQLKRGHTLVRLNPVRADDVYAVTISHAYALSLDGENATLITDFFATNGLGSFAMSISGALAARISSDASKYALSIKSAVAVSISGEGAINV